MNLEGLRPNGAELSFQNLSKIGSTTLQIAQLMRRRKIGID